VPLIPFSHPSARGKVPVNPSTGLVVPHVRAIDAEAGILEVYITTVSHPLARMVYSVEGQNVDRCYTFVEVRDSAVGPNGWATKDLRCRFDLVELATGIVLAEAGERHAPIDALHADPEAYWKEYDEMNVHEVRS
jgi:hypothetical protein